VVLKENIHDMEKAVKLFYELGFDSITFSPHLIPFSKNSLTQASIEKSAYKEWIRLKEEWANKFAVNGYGFSIDHKVNDCVNRVTSGSIFINCTGDVSPCCMLAHHVPIYKKGFIAKNSKDCSFTVGNIAFQDIKEILNSENYKQFIDMFLSSHLPEQCLGCRVVNTKLLHKENN
jgi:MoaA/NifB/PqqE/SkfB family radical SAM enzyme